MSHIAWPDIESFSSVRKCLQVYPELLRGRTTVQYRPKIKIHGSNAAIQIRNGKFVAAQSRERIITPGQDNAGFAAWVESVKDQILARFAGRPDTIVWGEWCGKGVMKGVAASQIPKKVFAVFAAADIPVQDDTPMWVSMPALEELVAGLPDTYVLPWYGETIDIPMLETAEVVQPILDRINEDVSKVEACDPWVKDVFGIEGVGEGLVYYPLGADRKQFSDLTFKAKGERHKVVAKTKPAQLDPAVAASAVQFAEMVLTEARLEQGVRSIAKGELVFDKKLIGPFMAWVGKDVEKETTAELEASGLEWKQVHKTVGDKARTWYLAKATAL